MRKVAVINARIGSKGLVHKNLRIFEGESLLRRTLRFAAESGAFEMIIACVDSPELSIEASTVGGVVIVNRPRELGGDDVPQLEVLKFLVSSRHICALDYIVLLQPTNLIRKFYDLSHLWDVAGVSDDVISVSRLSFGSHTLYSQAENGELRTMSPDGGPGNRQGKQQVFWRNGAYYGFPASNLVEKNIIISSKPKFFEIDLDRIFNVDYLSDLVAAKNACRKNPELSAF